MSILAKFLLATKQLDRRLWLMRVAAVAGAVLLGLVAIFFAQAGELAQQAFARAFAAHPVLASASTPFVFVAVVGLTRRWFPEARGSGIPQVMAAGHNPAASANGPLISLRTAAAKFAGTLLMLLGGGAVGREGPTVQFSAALMVAVHRWMRVPINAGIIIAGGAAGVSAAFNTPLAGVAFAIEELAAAFEQKVALMVMAAVMISGLVSLGIAGDYVYFGAMTRHMAIRDIAVLAPLMGVLGGLTGGAFSRTLIAMSASGHPLFVRARANPIKLAFVCGVVVGGLGLATGGVSWGTGYETTRTLLGGGDAALAFGPAKFVATLATALSGAPGGIFAPSLSVGAGLGQLVSLVTTGAPSGALVLLGVAAYFTGVVRAPLTAVIIVTEMTADRAMIIPLFITALIADWVSSKVCHAKLYHALAQGFRAGPAKQDAA